MGDSVYSLQGRRCWSAIAQRLSVSAKLHFHARHQFAERQIERLGQSPHRRQGRHLQAALDLADVASVKIAQFCQSLLCQPRRLA